MTSYGIYTQWDRGSRELPKVRRHTREIPAELDIEFGSTLRILRAKGSNISFVMKHPPFCDDEGNVRPDFTGEQMVNSNAIKPRAELFRYIIGVNHLELALLRGSPL